MQQYAVNETSYGKNVCPIQLACAEVVVDSVVVMTVTIEAALHFKN